MSTHYLGIDLHKRSSMWVLLDNERIIHTKKSIPCTPDAVTAAIRNLSVAPDEITAAIEPVEGWRWYVPLLEEAGMRVRVANPLKLRAIAESKQKNDTNDATTLAELARVNYFPESYRDLHRQAETNKSASDGENTINVIVVSEDEHRSMNTTLGRAARLACWRTEFINRSASNDQTTSKG